MLFQTPCISADGQFRVGHKFYLGCDFAVVVIDQYFFSAVKAAKAACS